MKIFNLKNLKLFPGDEKYGRQDPFKVPMTPNFHRQNTAESSARKGRQNMIDLSTPKDRQNMIEPSTPKSRQNMVEPSTSKHRQNLRFSSGNENLGIHGDDDDDDDDEVRFEGQVLNTPAKW